MQWVNFGVTVIGKVELTVAPIVHINKIICIVHSTYMYTLTYSYYNSEDGQVKHDDKIKLYAYKMLVTHTYAKF